MSVNLVPKHAVLEFSAAVAMLLNTKGGKFRSRVMNGTHKGEGASPVNQFGSVEMAAPAGRFSPRNLTQIDVARRWVYPNDREVSVPLDRYDLQRLIEDPKGPIAEAVANAVAREEDRQIIAAFNASAATGVRGASSEAFDTANYRIATGSVGLTVDKLREVRRKFARANVDLESERIQLAITPFQMDDLLSQIEVTSADFVSGRALEEGKILRYMGMDIFESNLLPLSSTTRSCFAWVKSGMHFGTWMSPEMDVYQDKSLAGDPWITKGMMVTGATRLEQGRVIEVLCTEA